MIRFTASLTLLGISLLCCLVTKEVRSSSRVLVWRDEFDGTSLNLTNWQRQVLPAYSQNNELEYYTNRPVNSFVSNGFLTIRAQMENYEGASYTSGRITTSVDGNWLYGRIEARAQLPTGEGVWPAIWMLPTDSVYGPWPDSGEIDIMEAVTCTLNVIFGTIHTQVYNHISDTQKGGTTEVASVADFHVYAIEWTPTTVDFFVDDVNYFTYDNDLNGNSETWPFNQEFYLIMNIAVGGDFGGSCLNGALPVWNSTQDMVVDYVRVYAQIPCTDVGGDPYTTGTFLTCCPNLVNCLQNWSGNGVYSYKCVDSQTTCDAMEITAPPTPPILCTALGGNPYTTGSLINCCSGLVECLQDWNDNNNYYYLCSESQAACNAGEVTFPPSPPSTTTLPTTSPTHIITAHPITSSPSTGHPTTTSAPTQQPKTSSPISTTSPTTLTTTKTSSPAASTASPTTQTTKSPTKTSSPAASTIAPTAPPPTTLAPVTSNDLCQTEQMKCGGHNIQTNEACFSVTQGNLATGVGFAVWVNLTCSSGGLGCIGNSGCQNCRLSNAAPTHWSYIPLCPYCVCDQSSVNNGLCAPNTCSNDVVVTESPSTSSGAGSFNGAVVLSTGTIAAVSGSAVAFAGLAIVGIALYARRRKSSNQLPGPEGITFDTHPVSSIAFHNGTNLNTANPVFHNEANRNPRYNPANIDI